MYAPRELVGNRERPGNNIDYFIHILPQFNPSEWTFKAATMHDASRKREDYRRLDHEPVTLHCSGNPGLDRCEFEGNARHYLSVLERRIKRIEGQNPVENLNNYRREESDQPDDRWKNEISGLRGMINNLKKEFEKFKREAQRNLSHATTILPGNEHKTMALVQGYHLPSGLSMKVFLAVGLLGLGTLTIKWRKQSHNSNRSLIPQTIG